VVAGAAASVRDAADKLGADGDPADPRSVQSSLTQAADLVGSVLDSTQKAVDVAEKVGSKLPAIIGVLGPLVTKLGVAALWVGRLWLGL
jgi:hypothetical protein